LACFQECHVSQPNTKSPARDANADAKLPTPTTLGMAASFTASMAEWAASGFQTVTQQRHDLRLAACTGCKYHESPHCTLCGCFTDKKAWLPHEDCPVGKWPG
jgi:hypothetical protein